MKRGEVWLVNLDPVIGAEIKKTRPAVILSNDSVGILPLKVIVPVTEWKDHFTDVPWLVQITPDRQNGLSKTSAADAFQIRSVSQQRITTRLGRLTTSQMASILEAAITILSDI